MKGKKATQQRAAVTELEKSIDLVRAPAALLQHSEFAPKIKVKVSESQPEEERMEEWKKLVSKHLKDFEIKGKWSLNLSFPFLSLAMDGVWN